MVDIAANPRIHHLIAEVERLRDKSDDSGRIDACYLEIGRYVHWMLRQDPTVLARLEAEGRAWAERTDGQAPRQPSQDTPFAPDPQLVEQAEADLRWAHAPEGTRRISGRDEETGVVVPATSAEFRADDGTWQPALDTVLDLVGDARIGRHADRAAILAQMLATTDHMDARWSEFPGHIQHALLNFLGSRIRLLQDRYGVEIELKYAAARLRQYHELHPHGDVPSLADTGAPMHGSWESDAVHWWTVLRGV